METGVSAVSSPCRTELKTHYRGPEMLSSTSKTGVSPIHSFEEMRELETNIHSPHPGAVLWDCFLSCVPKPLREAPMLIRVCWHCDQIPRERAAQG